MPIIQSEPWGKLTFQMNKTSITVFYLHTNEIIINKDIFHKDKWLFINK